MGSARRMKYPGYLKVHKDKLMRYLYFDAEGGLKEPSTTYEMIYDSLYNAPGGYEGPNENRIVSRVFDKLEKIGTATRRNNQDLFSLAETDVVRLMAIEDTEFELVMKVLKSIRWTGAYSRRATEMFDWLEKSPREERQKVEEVVAEASA